jgi:flagellar motor switch protein FliM
MLEQMLGRSGMEQWISSSTTAVEPEVRDEYEEALRETQVDLSAELGRTVLSVTELAQLQEGDVIPLDRKTDDPIKVFVNDKPKFEAVPGRSGRRRALRITSAESPENVDFDSLTPSPDHEPEYAQDAPADGTDGAGDAPGAAERE